MPMQKRWSDLKKEKLDDEPNNFGVYEIGLNLLSL